ncbi:MAG: hypothetical protein WB755_02665 [Terriglobales bacterium]
MQPVPPKSKSYGTLAILGAVLGLIFWHPGLSGMAKPSNVTLAQNTAITVRLDQNIGSKTSTSGQRFGGKLAQPLLVNGREVLPAGTEFSGTVTKAEPAGKLAGGAALHISINSFSFQGKEYKIQAPPLVRVTQGQGKRTAEVTGVGAVFGAVIGAAAGGGKGAAIGAAAGAGAGAVGAVATNKTRDIVLPAESLVTFHLGESVTIAIKPASRAHHTWILS